MRSHKRMHKMRLFDQYALFKRPIKTMKKNEKTHILLYRRGFPLKTASCHLLSLRARKKGSIGGLTGPSSISL